MCSSAYDAAPDVLVFDTPRHLSCVLYHISELDVRQYDRSRPATDAIYSYDRNTYLTIPLTRERNLRATDHLRRGVVVMIIFDCNVTIITDNTDYVFQLAPHLYI